MSIRIQQRGIIQPHRNEAWDLAATPPELSVLIGKWVYTVRRDSSSDELLFRIEYRNFESDDGYLSFALVLNSMTNKMILAMAAHSHLKVRLFHVVAAFLIAIVKPEVFVGQLAGSEQAKDLVCRLKSAFMA